MSTTHGWPSSSGVWAPLICGTAFGTGPLGSGYNTTFHIAIGRYPKRQQSCAAARVTKRGDKIDLVLATME
jgi:hypothetical protein